MAVGRVNQGLDQEPSDPGPSLAGVDVDVTNPTDIRIIEIGIDVESPDGAKALTESHLHEGLTGFVESVGPVPPLGDEPGDQLVAFGLVLVEERVQVRREIGDSSGLWHHEVIV